MLSLMMMAKNEEKSILASLVSVKDICDEVYLLDTGSTDETINVVQAWCLENGKDLYIKETKFVDFEITRNELVEWRNNHAKDTSKWCIYLDSGDEYRGNSQGFLDFTRRVPVQCDALVITQSWDGNSKINSVCIDAIKQCKAFEESLFTGVSITEQELSAKLKILEHNLKLKFRLYPNVKYETPKEEPHMFKNIRLTRGTNWHYIFKIHENFSPKVESKKGVPVTVPNELCILHQDRGEHGFSSFKRFYRDAHLLSILSLNSSPNNSEPKKGADYSRYLHYLGQTYGLLGSPINSLFMYDLRAQQASLNIEETAAALYNCSSSALSMGQYSLAERYALYSFLCDPTIKTLNNILTSTINFPSTGRVIAGLIMSFGSTFLFSRKGEKMLNADVNKSAAPRAFLDRVMHNGNYNTLEDFRQAAINKKRKNNKINLREHRKNVVGNKLKNMDLSYEAYSRDLEKGGGKFDAFTFMVWFYRWAVKYKSAGAYVLLEIMAKSCEILFGLEFLYKDFDIIQDEENGKVEKYAIMGVFFKNVKLESIIDYGLIKSLKEKKVLTLDDVYKLDG